MLLFFFVVVVFSERSAHESTDRLGNKGNTPSYSLYFEHGSTLRRGHCVQRGGQAAPRVRRNGAQTRRVTPPPFVSELMKNSRPDDGPVSHNKRPPPRVPGCRAATKARPSRARGSQRERCHRSADCQGGSHISRASSMSR